jgi:hypothetical protein
MQQERRGVKLTVRLTGEEHEQLRNLAHAARLQLAEFVRAAALGREVTAAAPSVPELNREAYADLARLASNLNQISHNLHLGLHSQGREAELFDLLTRVSMSTRVLRSALVGGDK